MEIPEDVGVRRTRERGAQQRENRYRIMGPRHRSQNEPINCLSATFDKLLGGQLLNRSLVIGIYADVGRNGQGLFDDFAWTKV